MDLLILVREACISDEAVRLPLGWGVKEEQRRKQSTFNLQKISGGKGPKLLKQFSLLPVFSLQLRAQASLVQVLEESGESNSWAFCSGDCGPCGGKRYSGCPPGGVCLCCAVSGGPQLSQACVPQMGDFKERRGSMRSWIGVERETKEGEKKENKLTLLA